MERKIILASHHRFAAGLKDTVEFIAGELAENRISTLTAYLDNAPIKETVADLMQAFPASTEVIILTDMMAGSVNQTFFGYRLREHTHLVSGMNLPLALAFTMEPQDNYLTAQRVREIVAEAQQAVVYINDIRIGDDDDE
ncbi:PTS sugar transporter subunit IIA [Liquorilactobacillus satsumensis]|uniref:PTS sugar transporter subunit IIA n=1 Tax=Liquorilactobacillus TaxID=2767888 RepID=UPI0021C26728|nr:PTS N-acetylglucosamine transporter subunit IIBC [Liquorilactobacillus satsumensis]MCP9328107.1 PTS N-acetylglucosamine transporter subunit IIBC [Liquorilactobacillus satsumensis]